MAQESKKPMATKTIKFSVKTGLTDRQVMDDELQKPEFLNRAQILFEETKISVDLKEELKINDNDLVSSMVEHSGNFGWWASLNTTAKRILRRLKREADKTKSSLDIEARSSLIEDKIKVTEEAVRSWLNNDPRTTKFSEDIMSLEDIIEFTDTVLRALEHKRDMLKEINRAQCSEQFNERHQ